MSYSKSLPFIVALVVCLSATAADAGQRGGGSSRGGGSNRGGGSGAGHVGPSSPGRPGVLPSRGIGPYRGYSYPYYRYPYYGRGYPYLGFGFGLSFGYGYYPYGYYGYPYGYPYPYRPYGYTVAVPEGSVSAGAGSGGLRIQDAAADAQVFADGDFVGSMQDFAGAVVSLEAGRHQIEIRTQDQPPIQFTVNIQAGQTLTYHAGRR
jgi:hypothetical protein